MKLLKAIISVSYIIFLAVLFAMISAWIKSSLSQYSMGWDGIADVLLYLCIGFTIGFVFGIISLKFMSFKMLWKSCIAMLCLVSIVFILIYFQNKPKILQEGFNKETIANVCNGFKV